MSWLMSPIIFGTTVIEKLVYVRRGYLNALLGVVKVIFRQADMLAKLSHCKVRYKFFQKCFPSQTSVNQGMHLQTSNTLTDGLFIFFLRNKFSSFS